MDIKTRPFSSLPEEKRDYLLNSEKTATGFHVCDMRGQFPSFWIFYNDDGEKGRWLYTISHEIGHIVLRHGSNPTEEQESEAEYFAKQLMAPRCLVAALGMCSPKVIHDSFGLSWEAATYLSDSTEQILRNRGGKPYANDEEFLNWCVRKGWLK